MIRRPPRSTRVRSSAASDVYKRQVCRCRIGVPKDGGEDRQFGGDVLLSLIPVDQCADRVGVADVVWPRAGSLPGSFQTDLSDELAKPAVERVCGQPRTSVGDEERRCHWLGEEQVAQMAVVAKCADGRLVQRHFAL